MNKDLETTTNIIGFFIKNLDVPSEVKKFLFEVTENIENKKELEIFIKIIEDAYVQQKIVENNSEFQKKEKEIDDDTIEKINNLLTK